jgi:hypothetical protein
MFYQNHADLQTSGMSWPSVVYHPVLQFHSLSTPTAKQTGHNSFQEGTSVVAKQNPLAYGHLSQSTSKSHAPLEHTMPSSPNSALRATAQHNNALRAMPPVDYEPQRESAESTIKKTRKRADARQLEVLNAAYARTASPSTEECAQLAKELDISARSVRIWSAYSLVYTVIHN